MGKVPHAITCCYHTIYNNAILSTIRWREICFKILVTQDYLTKGGEKHVHSTCQQ